MIEHEWSIVSKHGRRTKHRCMRCGIDVNTVGDMEPKTKLLAMILIQNRDYGEDYPLIEPDLYEDCNEQIAYLINVK